MTNGQVVVQPQTPTATVAMEYDDSLDFNSMDDFLSRSMQ